MTTNKKETGDLGEKKAAAYLLENDYKILATNWRFLKAEIDIIALHNDFLVFVEVKTRATNDFGNPEEFVTPRQQKLIINAAHEFIIKNDRNEESRFDVIAVIIQNNKVMNIEHIEDAFYPTL
jgi:putative endonuclease